MTQNRDIADIANAKDWIRRDAASVWHGFTQMGCYADNSPIIVDRAEGRELIDVEGRRYFDAISSLWVVTLGHRVPALDEAVGDQLRRVAHSTLLGNGNRIVIELAEALAEVVPVDRPHMIFASDGASAVEQALKIAFQYWINKSVSGRHTFLTFDSGYHGDTIGSLSLGGGGFGSDLFAPLRFPVLRAPSYAHKDALVVAEQLVREHRDKLAAVVLEPLIQCAAGMFIADPTDFARLQKTCSECDVLLICDEVATGFGRTGTLFAAEQCGLLPDILCLGKGITGGYLPMSATIASHKVFDAFLGPDLSERTFFHGHSYGGNALAAAVALRHLQLIRSPDILRNVRERSQQLQGALESQLARYPLVAAIRIKGLMCAVELDTSREPGLARRVCASMVKQGVLSRSMGSVVTLVPPLTTTTQEIERIVTALVMALQDNLLETTS